MHKISIFINLLCYTLCIRMHKIAIFIVFSCVTIGFISFGKFFLKQNKFIYSENVHFAHYIKGAYNEKIILSSIVFGSIC